VQAYLRLIKAGLYLLAILFCGAVIGCQSYTQCCTLDYGLAQPSDLVGNWQILDEAWQLKRPTGRYKFPATDFKRQYLREQEQGSQDHIDIVHELRSYEAGAPLLGELNFQQDLTISGGVPFIPDVIKTGLSNQTLCREADLSDPDSASFICVSEVRYQHIISTTTFYFDLPISESRLTKLISQVLANTEERIRQIDRYLDESSS